MPIERFGSTGVTMHLPTADPQARFRTDGPTTMAVAELAAGAVLGRHPAVGPQLLSVVAGTVTVAGDDGRWQSLSAGEAVLFAPGEEHETRADAPATLAILEWAGSPDPGGAG
ncbi:cupin domain-containing protein [Nakamurella lactea]|uniref:cupin domain-containing protein n=1 Tax=Nakamurella lactea TaxID=459515 RepID=UPI0012B5871E|nr:cupin domain-containing protein [Nakamurella lactea]